MNYFQYNLRFKSVAINMENIGNYKEGPPDASNSK